MENEKFHPLKIWNDKGVTDLLIDFFRANFQKAGLDPLLGEKAVKLAWEQRGKTDVSRIMEQVFSLFEQAKKQIKFNPDEAEPLSFFNLANARTFLDIGANKLTTINYFAKKYPGLQKLIGVDTIAQNGDFLVPEKSVYYQVDPEADSYPIANKSVDCINIQFVFHHLKDLSAIKRILSICRRIISPRGSLILWEETFADKVDAKALTLVNRRMNIQTDKDLTRRFYNFDKDKRIQFIAANDWIINCGNPHMPWTGQYYSWKEWVAIMLEAGLSLTKQYNFGLRINGRLKQGVWMIGIFKADSR